MAVTQIQEGFNQNFIVDSPGGITCFVKKLRPTGEPRHNPFKQLNWRLTHTIFRSPHRSHMRLPDTPYSPQNLDKEVLTWQCWKEAGIPVLDLYAVDRETLTLAWEYKPHCLSFDVLLNQGRPQYRKFELLMDLMDEIRTLAIRHNNSLFLHSDPGLVNFLYHTKEDRVYPIDAAVIMETGMDIHRLNIFTLNMFLGSLLGLELPDLEVRNYVRLFSNHLTPEEARDLYHFKRRHSLFHNWYFGLRNFRQHRIKKRPKKQFLCFEDVIFQQRYAHCAQDILRARF